MTMEQFEVLSTKIENAISLGFRLCLILRGLPGRGKTYLAKMLENYCQLNSFSVSCHAADDYMIDPSGVYHFDRSNLSNAHFKCRQALIDAMEQGTHVVIQHNTNVTEWESLQLRSSAESMHYLVVVLEPQYAWCLDDELPLEMQSILTNTHNVSKEHLVSMKTRKQNLFPRYVGHWIQSEKICRSCIDQYQLEQSSICSNEENFAVLFALNNARTKQELFHVTTDFLKSLSIDVNLADLTQDILTRHRLYVLALFKCSVGIGAIVSSYQSFNDDVTVPFYAKYAHVESLRLPHITIHVNDGNAAKDIGPAAYQFEDRLLKSCESISGGWYRDEDFVGYIYHTPVSIETIYCGSFGLASSSEPIARWSFTTAIDKKVFTKLYNSSEVTVVTASIPSLIIACTENQTWTIADLRINPPRGRSDDQLYSESDFLRRFLPRGLCYISSPDGHAVKVVNGMPKFTGQEDDLEDDNNAEVTKFFNRPLHTTSNPWILAMEKANGEAAHVSAIKINDQFYFVSGSKNVHILTHIDHPDDIQLYEGQRYEYAKEIASCLYEVMIRIGDENRRNFINVLVDNKWTAIFEYEDPAHPHIVPIFQKKIKFITFMKSGLIETNSDASIAPVSTESSDSQYLDSQRSSVSALPPTDAFRIIKNFGMDTVWSFPWKIVDIAQLQYRILIESHMKIEGCVLYYMDENEVIGLVKCKNGYYVCSRAIREKMCQYRKKIQHEIEAIFKPNQLAKILHSICKVNNENYESLCRDYIHRGAQRLNEKLTLHSSEVKKSISKRFDVMTTSQIMMTEDCKRRWIELGSLLTDKFSHDTIELVLYCITRVLHDVNESLFTIPMEESAVEIVDDIRQPLDIPKQSTRRIDSLVNNLWNAIENECKRRNFTEEDVRSKWPTIWESLVDGNGGVNIQLIEEIRNSYAPLLHESIESFIVSTGCD